MSTYTDVLTKTLLATGAVGRGRFVGLSGAQIASAGVEAFGLALHDMDEGEAAPVVVQGSALAEAGAAISAGSKVQSDDSGRAIAYQGGGVLGIALEAASDAGEFIEVLLVPAAELAPVQIVEDIESAVEANRFVSFDADARIDDLAMVTLHAAEEGEDVAVRIAGIVWLEAGAVVDGRDVQADDQGRVIPWAGGVRRGLALADAAEAGELIPVLLQFEKKGRTITAGVDLVAYRFLDGSGLASPAGGTIGLNAQSALSGQRAMVRSSGSAYCEAGGAIESGGLIEIGSDGKGVARRNGVAVARALQPSTDDGDVIFVELLPGVDDQVLEVTASGSVAAHRFVASGAQVGAGAAADGVAAHAAGDGENLIIRIGFLGYVEAGAAVAAGADLESDASGRAVTQSSGETLGVAVEAASAAGDIIQVRLDV